MDTSTETRPPAPTQDLGSELRSSALLLGLSFGLTAVVVTAAQAAASLLGS